MSTKKEMYRSLFHSVTDAIALLQAAQQKNRRDDVPVNGRSVTDTKARGINQYKKPPAAVFHGRRHIGWSSYSIIQTRPLQPSLMMRSMVS